MGHFPLQIYNVKHKITLSPRFAIQKRNSEVILAKTIVKSPEENGPVLQFYKRYEIKECPYRKSQQKKKNTKGSRDLIEFVSVHFSHNSDK